MKASNNIRCFFDICIDDVPSGRIIFELFNHICPNTCENFKALCTGEAGIGKTTGKALHYQGVKFHRVIKDFMIQAGDFSAGNGTGGESIFGGCFDDENFNVRHESPFLLSMANRGRNTNGSQFFINVRTTQPAPHLDGKHVVFGRVVSGQDVVVTIEESAVDNKHRPLSNICITRCGELISKVKSKEKKKSKREIVESDSDSDGDKKKKKKKKEKKKKKIKKAKKEKMRGSDSEEGELEEAEDGEADSGRGLAEKEIRSGRLVNIKRTVIADPFTGAAATERLVLRSNPLLQSTHINPEEIPDVPKNRFLFRAGPQDRDAPVRDTDRRRNDKMRRGRDTFGKLKIKGRGTVRYIPMTRSRTPTPPHWRQEQSRTIPLEIHQRRVERQLERETELEERRKRREERHRLQEERGTLRPRQAAENEKEAKRPKKEPVEGDWREAREQTNKKADKEPLAGRRQEEPIGRRRQLEHPGRKREEEALRRRCGTESRLRNGHSKDRAHARERRPSEAGDSEDELKESDTTMGDLNKILDYGDDNALDYDPIDDEDEDKDEQKQQLIDFAPADTAATDNERNLTSSQLDDNDEGSVSNETDTSIAKEAVPSINGHDKEKINASSADLSVSKDKDCQKSESQSVEEDVEATNDREKENVVSVTVEEAEINSRQDESKDENVAVNCESKPQRSESNEKTKQNNEVVKNGKLKDDGKPKESRDRPGRERSRSRSRGNRDRDHRRSLSRYRRRQTRSRSRGKVSIRSSNRRLHPTRRSVDRLNTKRKVTRSRSRDRKSRSRGRKSRSRDRKSRSRDRKSRSRGRISRSRGRKSRSRGRKSRSRDRKTRSRDRKSRSRDHKSRSRDRKSRSRDRKSRSRDRKSRSRDRKSRSRIRSSRSLDRSRHRKSRSNARSHVRRSRSRDRRTRSRDRTSRPHDDKYSRRRSRSASSSSSNSSSKN